MSAEDIAGKLEAALAEAPLLDAHTHLTNGELSARGLHDVLLYHMVISDLYAAGCPSGARLTEFPGRPTDEEARARIQEAIPYVKHVRNTSGYWILRRILADLYDWTEPIAEDNWKRLDSIIRERADDRAWQREILERAKIRGSVTELARRGDGRDDDCLQYSMEWAFFTRTQRGEFDTALYELERCWGKPPGSPIPHGATGRPAAEREIRTVADVHDAMQHYVKELASAPVISMATHVSTEIRFSRVTDEQMAQALSRRETAGPAERDIYASYIHEAFLTALAAHADKIVFQFSFGAEPLPHETFSMLPQRAIADLADTVARHPNIRFACMHSSRHANQSLCTLCRELPNLSLMGYWWHNFFPDAIRQVMAERLDMLPVNKQVGFFSDAYCLEWAYGKAWLIRKLLAQVLAEMVRLGRYSVEEALAIARSILFETAQSVLGVQPRTNG